MFLVAWRNLVDDRVRFAVTLTGIAFAVLLMILEGSLLVGFTRAASQIVTAAKADIWITARGVRAVDLPGPLPDRFRDIVRGIDGVRGAERVVVGFAQWSPPSGNAHTVLLVGADRGIRGPLPRPRLSAAAATSLFESVVVDVSSAAELEVLDLPTEVELGSPRQRAVVQATTTGFGTFLGPPYAFTDYEDAVRYLGWPTGETAFLAVRLDDSARLEELVREISSRLPETVVWPADQFARQSSRYWLVQTGAGGALLTAAALGLLVGLVIVAQNMYAITLQHIEEFATLRALGASQAYVAAIISLQALASGVLGTALGTACAAAGVRYVSGFIPWIAMPLSLVFFVATVGLAMCLVASVIAIRPAMSADPASVFRA